MKFEKTVCTLYIIFICTANIYLHVDSTKIARED